MKYLWLLAPLLVTGCSSVRYVTTDHGHIITQNNQRVNIVGNPPVICHTCGGKIYSGYFEYQDDGTIVLDDFGRGTILIRDCAVCELKLDTSNSD
jgi:hypothetical protein